ncbi:hypothetical protein BDN72DRAFT_812540 [Pluteus cervinus]|uniref:Uncharacterized protein n=1 Tax=Pluteus cervinus TaxID=181527 RepID=A0ACD3B9X6_9AGAR|nr:hypothetical protein BDN72DRAFT_812540 [Pluteus cervinus]
MSPFTPQDLPVDILPPILSHLSGTKDWHACALVSKLFNTVATPLLYRSLHSARKCHIHPATTLLQRPELAKYVRHVTETGAVHRGLSHRYPNITRDTLAAIALCRNLRSMTWADEEPNSDTTLLQFLAVLRSLPLRELTIKTHSDLGESVWSELIKLNGLEKIAIWCMEGPPRVLQGWSELLGTTLTKLELGRCAGVPPTILITVLSQLPLLRDLRLKGAQAHTIPIILSFLPNLKSLDTEYFLFSANGPRSRPNTNALPTLQNLTVRTSSIDTMGPQKLWQFILELVPNKGLETLKLHAFTINMGHTSVPRMFILDLARIHEDTLKHFIVGEAQLTLKDIECLCSKFPKLETLNCSVASPDVASIAAAISGAKNLRRLRLQVQWIPATQSQCIDEEETFQEALASRSTLLEQALARAALGSAKGDVTRPMPPLPPFPRRTTTTATPTRVTQHVTPVHRASLPLSAFSAKADPFDGHMTHYRTRLGVTGRQPDSGMAEQEFTMEAAMDLMLRDEESQLRVIGIGATVYTGKWVLEEPQDEAEDVGCKQWRGVISQRKIEERRLRFEVVKSVAEDRWDP